MRRLGHRADRRSLQRQRGRRKVAYLRHLHRLRGFSEHETKWTHSRPRLRRRSRLDRSLLTMSASQRTNSLTSATADCTISSAISRRRTALVKATAHAASADCAVSEAD